MAPSWFQKSSKNLSKINPENHQNVDLFLDRFLDHLGSILGPKLGPCWRHFRPKWGKATGVLPLLRCVGVFFRFLGAAGRWGTPFFRFFGWSWPHLGSIFGSFWLHVGAKLALCWGLLAHSLGGLVGLREAKGIGSFVYHRYICPDLYVEVLVR